MIGHTKVSGPLEVFADGFRAELERLGYTRSSREHKLAEVAWLSTWLDKRGLGVGDICSARLQSSSLTWPQYRGDHGAPWR